MVPRSGLISIALSLCCSSCIGQVHDGSPAATQSAAPRVIVAAPTASSDSVIAVPPETSWTGSLNFAAKRPVATQHAGDLADWIGKESALNGLRSTDLTPWHIVISFDQFDDDGDNVHSGVFEEFWVGPKEYKLTYKTDDLSQTDYATGQGLFRSGDQQWPNRAEVQVRAEVTDPFYYAASLQGFHPRSAERVFGARSLDCVDLERTEPGAISGPTQYCFDHDGSALRYIRGEGWFQTTYNGIVSFQGRNIAQEAEVTDGGKPYLKMRVESIETISSVDERDFVPPQDAIPLQGKRLSGVRAQPLHTAFPEWPNSLRQQHFSVTVEIVIGKDGKVVSAQATAGPPEAYKAAESTARKWLFQPYLVLGEPTEVETKIVLSNN